jgi:hypothetical protein
MRCCTGCCCWARSRARCRMNCGTATRSWPGGRSGRSVTWRSTSTSGSTGRLSGRSPRKSRLSWRDRCWRLSARSTPHWPRATSRDLYRIRVRHPYTITVTAVDLGPERNPSASYRASVGSGSTSSAVRRRPDERVLACGKIYDAKVKLPLRATDGIVTTVAVDHRSAEELLDDGSGPRRNVLVGEEVCATFLASSRTTPCGTNSESTSRVTRVAS